MNRPRSDQATSQIQDSIRLQYYQNLRWSFRGGALCALGATMLLNGNHLVGMAAIIVGWLLAKPKKIRPPSEEFWSA